MFEAIFSVFSLRYPEVIVYMLQSTEYRVWPFLRWFWRTNNFSRVAKRRKLERTKVTHLLLLILRIGMIFQILLGMLLLMLGFQDTFDWGSGLGVALLV